MSHLDFSLAQLRGLIGQRVMHRGIACSVIEVLEDGPALVLRDLEGNTAIQDNQYGDPRRRVGRTYTVPVLDEAGSALHAEFLQLELLEG